MSRDSASFVIAKQFLHDDERISFVQADHRQPLLQQKWSADQDKAVADRNRFVYSARSIPLIGRDPELADIESFIEDPSHRFAWRILHGPGGVGKSRLALEAVLRQRGGWWHAGFLNELHAGPDWTVWQPRLPTFIVIDYRQDEKLADKVRLERPDHLMVESRCGAAALGRT